MNDSPSCLPLNTPLRFAHADLHPQDIIVDEATGTITGISDWATVVCTTLLSYLPEENILNLVFSTGATNCNSLCY